MKKIIFLICLLAFYANINAQEEIIVGKSLIVKNPPKYPYGINIDMSASNSRWAREFNFSQDGKGHLFSFGALADTGQLEYGYIGGNSNIISGNYEAPWMTFLPNGNIGVGTKIPVSKFEVNGSIKTNMLDVGDMSLFNLKSVLARLPEGGTGTYLGVKSYATQKYDNITDFNQVKSFAIEHMFINLLNSSINFYRGGSQQGGSVGISVFDGTEYFRFSKARLDVNGTIRAKEVTIEATGWADFVFAKDYNLPSLSEVKVHIEEKQHLPNIPSATEVKENGVNIGEMQIKLLQKIEELTLYVIDLKEEIIKLKEENDKQLIMINNIKSK